MSEAELQTYNSTETEAKEETRRRGRARTVCPECGGRLTTDEGRAEVTCADCGLVVEADQIDPGPEWRSFDGRDGPQRSRVGAPTTQMLHDKGLSTQIDWRNTDGYGKTLSASQRDRMRRLRTWDERFRTRNHKDRNLKQALGEIDRMASALGLSKEIRETASVIYRRALEADLLPGRSIEAIATASVYAAARQLGTPRTIDEVSAVTRVDETEFKRAYRYVVRELNLGVQLADPRDYVGRFASELDVSDETETRARELLEDGQNHGVTVGKNPVGLAAAALYAATLLTNEKRTQSDVGEVANVSEVTIRNRYKELLEAAEASGTGRLN
ncbi:MAG: transcription initiation factor IIB [Halobacteriota archaeon]